MSLVNLWSLVHALILFTPFLHLFNYCLHTGHFAHFLSFINSYHTICLILVTSTTRSLTTFLKCWGHVMSVIEHVLLLGWRRGVSYWFGKPWFLTENVAHPFLLGSHHLLRSQTSNIPLLRGSGNLAPCPSVSFYFGFCSKIDLIPEIFLHGKNYMLNQPVVSYMIYAPMGIWCTFFMWLS